MTQTNQAFRSEIWPSKMWPVSNGVTNQLVALLMSFRPGWSWPATRCRTPRGQNAHIQNCPNTQENDVTQQSWRFFYQQQCCWLAKQELQCRWNATNLNRKWLWLAFISENTNISIISLCLNMKVYIWVVTRQRASKLHWCYVLLSLVIWTAAE